MKVEEPDEVLPISHTILCINCGTRMVWKGGGFRFERDTCIDTARYECPEDRTQATLSMLSWSPRPQV